MIARKKKKSQKKTIVVWCAAAGVVVISFVCAWAIITGERKLPDITELEPEEFAEFVRSEEFRELEPRERRDFFRTGMESRMASQAEGYFNTPAEERSVYLDEIIDSMQSQREEMLQMRERFDPNEFGGRSGGGEDGRRGPPMGGERREEDRPQRRARTQEQRRARQEQTNPTVRVQMSEYRRALRRRMRER